jgi:hypothetical protein
VKTRFRIEPAGGRHPEDRWYAWLKDEWVLVPPEKIVPDFAPDGQPYLFLLAGIYNRSTYAEEKRAALDLWASHLRIAIASSEGDNVRRHRRA